MATNHMLFDKKAISTPLHHMIMIMTGEFLNAVLEMYLTHGCVSTIPLLAKKAAPFAKNIYVGVSRNLIIPCYFCLTDVCNVL